MEGIMSVTCSVFGHMAESAHTHNQGLDFATCHCCGCDLMRNPGAEWTKVPKGFNVVWREFGRTDDATSVAERMARIAPNPRARRARVARLRSHGERRPTKAGMLDLLRNLSDLRDLLDSCESQEDSQAMDPNGQYVICLPSVSATMH